ncbi:hypothetical protein E3N88_13840 [Mikania micrantha]|uniref:Wall-associated receptor kinase galacturonan-binding domain-containing protein n=1 Tax=Mikania micrantha TaxID=192012 RepID=A0A5N6NZN1_9ASTR|nr:hypothetical protein E3N88_13840 [Mikania micrantha]
MIKTCCLTQTASQPPPECPERCGNVTIPYPFGIGPGCSAHDTYSVTCNTTFNPPKPFITSINLEALEISLEGTVRVNNPVFNCCNGRTNHLVVNFTNTPFTYSTTATRFTAFGCNNKYTSFNSLKFINASLSSLESKYETDACKYAFMVDVVWFGRLIDMYLVQSMPSVPAVLDWRLSGSCGAFGPLDSGGNMSVCGSNAYCFNQSVCICSQGYEGNPYLPRGCQGKSIITDGGGLLIG